MRFKRHLGLEHGLQQIDIVPLIDMVLLLLIFFMLTSSFIMQPGIKVNLPKAVTSEIVKYENIEIVLSGENAVYLNGEEVTQDGLKGFLRQVAAKNRSIFIKADKRASLGRVVEIWGMCRDSGANQINIATNQE